MMRILLTRTDRIGDLVLSTPAIATVRASFPAAHLSMVTGKYNNVVVERNTDIDELLMLDDEARATHFGRGLRGYDIAIALAPRFVDLRLVGATRATRRIGYTYVRRWFAQIAARRYVDTMMISEADPDLCKRDLTKRVRHEVDQLLDLVALAGAQCRVTRLRLDVREEDREAIANLPAAPIVFHLGSRWFRNGSSLESTRALLDALGTLGRPIVVTVPAESRAHAAALEPLRRECVVAHDLSFFRWAAVFERAACVVTVDTGATHVASAVRRPTLVAFEHRYFELNSQEWAPYGVPSVLVRKPASEDAVALAQFREAVVEGVKSLIDA